jgi:hypothetical protein
VVLFQVFWEVFFEKLKRFAKEKALVAASHGRQ